jgi:hypothetical protein
MPPKTTPLSVRLSEEDSDFLTSLQINDAVTPSDKIRAIISQARLIEKGTKEYQDSLSFIKNILNPTYRQILDWEREQNKRSELISKFTDWVSEILAYYITSISKESRKPAKNIMDEIEVGLATRILSLGESILRMSITENSSCYNPKVLTDRLGPILELNEVIQMYRKSKGEKQ